VTSQRKKLIGSDGVGKRKERGCVPGKKEKEIQVNRCSRPGKMMAKVGGKGTERGRFGPGRTQSGEGKAGVKKSKPTAERETEAVANNSSKKTKVQKKREEYGIAIFEGKNWVEGDGKCWASDQTKKGKKTYPNNGEGGVGKTQGRADTFKTKHEKRPPPGKRKCYQTGVQIVKKLRGKNGGRGPPGGERTLRRANLQGKRGESEQRR